MSFTRRFCVYGASFLAVRLEFSCLTMNNFSKTQVFALQSLGYRLWHKRTDLRKFLADERHLAAEKARKEAEKNLDIVRISYEQAQEMKAHNLEREIERQHLAKVHTNDVKNNTNSIQNLNQELLNSAIKPQTAEKISSPEVLTHQTHHSCRLVLHSQIFFIYRHEQSHIWCFPSFFCDGEEFRLFADGREETLFIKALNAVKLHLSADLISDAAAFRLSVKNREEIKDGNLPDDLLAYCRDDKKQIICVGDKDFLAIVQNLTKVEIENISHCTHPVLALRYGEKKRQMWCDLLRIADKTKK